MLKPKPVSTLLLNVMQKISKPFVTFDLKWKNNTYIGPYYYKFVEWKLHKILPIDSAERVMVIYILIIIANTILFLIFFVEVFFLYRIEIFYIFLPLAFSLISIIASLL